jgi:hypothetical protein
LESALQYWKLISCTGNAIAVLEMIFQSWNRYRSTAKSFPA